MEEIHGVKGTLHDGIFFTEATIPGAKIIKHLRAEVARQNSTLAEVKGLLAADVKACRGTALMGFRYGQKKHDWTQLLSFKWDTESWYGEGDAVFV